VEETSYTPIYRKVGESGFDKKKKAAKRELRGGKKEVCRENTQPVRQRRCSPKEIMKEGKVAGGKGVDYHLGGRGRHHFARIVLPRRGPSRTQKENLNLFGISRRKGKDRSLSQKKNSEPG